MMMNLAVLIAALGGSDSAERARAAESLARMGTSAAPAAVELALAAADANEAVREWATAALEESGPPPATACGRLAELLSHANADAAYWAATLIGRLERAGAPAEAELTKALSERREPAVRQRAAWALGKIGAHSAAAIAALRQAAASDDPRLARLAREALPPA